VTAGFAAAYHLANGTWTKHGGDLKAPGGKAGDQFGTAVALSADGSTAVVGALELHPRMHADAGRFELIEAAGNERRTSGSYYTPTSLIARLLDSALNPVVDVAARSPDPEAAILGLRVLDPATRTGTTTILSRARPWPLT
jgi:hypothetical protein